MSRTIPAGTIIVCPNEACRSKVGTFVHDLNSGDALRLHLVAFEPDQPHTIGSLMHCVKCHEPYTRPDPAYPGKLLGQFHTSEGWKP